MTTPNLIKEEVVVVGLGEVTVTHQGNRTLACLGLGSCVGLAAYDPVAQVGGMAHIVLSNGHGKAGEGSAKYADVAVPLLIEKMKYLDALTSRLKVKIAGGAQMSAARGLGDVFNIGQDNVEAVTSALARHGISITASDTGGNRGRTFRLCLANGAATVSSAGTEDITL